MCCFLGAGGGGVEWLGIPDVNMHGLHPPYGTRHIVVAILASFMDVQTSTRSRSAVSDIDCGARRRDLSECDMESSFSGSVMDTDVFSEGEVCNVARWCSAQGHGAWETDGWADGQISV